VKFLEFQVEFEEGTLRGFDTWAEAKAGILEELGRRFRPFSISCVRYTDRSHRTLWTVRWEKPVLKATREERKALREQGAVCVMDLMKWSVS
jgi:hypothetical protein